MMFPVDTKLPGQELLGKQVEETLYRLSTVYNRTVLPMVVVPDLTCFVQTCIVRTGSDVYKLIGTFCTR